MIAGFIGFFMIVGIAGSSDYADEVGEVFRFSDYTKEFIIAFLLMIPCPIFENYLDKHYYMEGSDENDNRNCIA